MRVLDFVFRTDTWWRDLLYKEQAGTYMLGAGPAYPMLVESFGSLMDDAARERVSDEPPVAVGIATDQGPRLRNEDSAVVFVSQVGRGADAYPLVFAALADGMGGKPSGDVASAITIKMLTEHVLDHLIWPVLEGKTGEYDYSVGQILHIMRVGVNEANRAVLADAPDAGATLTCLLLRGHDAYLAHIGDCRAYWIDSDGLTMLTHDHSLVQFLEEAGYISSEGAAIRRQRNVLYHGIGIEDEIEVDTVHRALTSGSRLLLCSDGVWNSLTDDLIHDLTCRADKPDELCATLVDTAISINGSKDNATAVAIYVSD